MGCRSVVGYTNTGLTDSVRVSFLPHWRGSRIFCFRQGTFTRDLPSYRRHNRTYSGRQAPTRAARRKERMTGDELLRMIEQVVGRR